MNGKIEFTELALISHRDDYMLNKPIPFSLSGTVVTVDNMKTPYEIKQAMNRYLPHMRLASCSYITVFSGPFFCKVYDQFTIIYSLYFPCSYELYC